MMKMVSLTVLSIVSVTLITVTACRNRSQAVEKAPEYDNDSISFYPAGDFLQSQINMVSTTPFFIYKIEITDGHKDSVVLNRPAFLAAASIFTSFSFEDSTVKKYYKEQVFADQATNSINLHYTTRNIELPLQSATVLLHPETKRVKRIMMEATQGTPDSTVYYKLSWKANERFSVITITKKKGEPEHTTQSNVVWNGN